MYDYQIVQQLQYLNDKVSNLSTWLLIFVFIFSVSSTLNLVRWFKNK